MRAVITFLALVSPLAPSAVSADPAGRLMAESCTLCHGAGGHGPGAIPSLAGKHSDEMMKVLLAFRDGSRPATVMDRLARGYSLAQLQAITDELAARGGGGGR